MIRPSPAAQSTEDQASVAGTASLALLGLLFIGLFTLGIATTEVPTHDTALALSPVLYFVTVMVGLVATFFGFLVLEFVFVRSCGPIRGWSATALAILVSSPVLFATAASVGGPAVALGIAANALGATIALLWSARMTASGRRAAWLSTWTSLVLIIVAGCWVAIDIQRTVG